MSLWEHPRRESRYQLQIPVVLIRGHQELSLVTRDASFSGMFVPTENPLPERELVRLRVEKEPGGVLNMTAMIVHVLEGRSPGAGLKLYGVDGPSRDRWARIIVARRDSDPDVEAKPVRVKVSEDADRRLHDRYAAVLQVHARTLEDMVTTYTRDISRGGAFLMIQLKLKAGDELFVELVHPDTRDVFGLKCRVRRAVRDGVGVEFLQLDDKRREAFWDFVEPAVELDIDDVIFD